MQRVVLKSDSGALESFAAFALRDDAVTIFRWDNCPDELAELCLSGDPTWVHVVPNEMRFSHIPGACFLMVQLADGCVCFE